MVMVCYNNVLFWLHVSQIKKCWGPWSGVTDCNVSIISMAYVVGYSKQRYEPLPIRIHFPSPLTIT
jgi:hypothetical protein